MTGRRTDQLVYELYELTDDEIGIVERATHASVALNSFMLGVATAYCLRRRSKAIPPRANR